jgi:hypothetical protein
MINLFEAVGELISNLAATDAGHRRHPVVIAGWIALAVVALVLLLALLT